MKIFYLAILILVKIILPHNCIGQPYSGTIFIDPDIITSSDPTTIQSTTYTGQGMRTVFDRRTASWVNINAYLFDIIWNDGLTSEAQVNPEFGSVGAATIEAEKYASIIGQLPTCLREDVDALWIHLGTEPFGGGNNSILIHTGQSALYEGQGILEETLVHEASHSSLDFAHASSLGWVAAQNLDSTFISTYALDNPTREDIAESFLTWLAVRQCNSRISELDSNLISQAIPNRIIYFDNQNFNMYPVCITSVSIDEIANNDFTIYPNPSFENITINSNHSKEIQFVEIYSSDGKLVLKNAFKNINSAININNLTSGIYLIVLINKEGLRFTNRLIKN